MKEIPLTQEECHCGFADFYKLVAEKAGYTENEATMYNASRIHITVPVKEEIWKHYKDMSLSRDEFREALMIYYAKVDLKGDDYRAVLDDGFVENGDYDRIK